MTQTTKRRTGLFPYFQSSVSAMRGKAARGGIAKTPDEVLAPACLGRAAVITARGQRFPITQIGSIFGSE